MLFIIIERFILYINIKNKKKKKNYYYIICHLGIEMYK